MVWFQFYIILWSLQRRVNKAAAYKEQILSHTFIDIRKKHTKWFFSPHQNCSIRVWWSQFRFTVVVKSWVCWLICTLDSAAKTHSCGVLLTYPTWQNCHRISHCCKSCEISTAVLLSDVILFYNHAVLLIYHRSGIKYFSNELLKIGKPWGIRCSISLVHISRKSMRYFAAVFH